MAVFKACSRHYDVTAHTGYLRVNQTCCVLIYALLLLTDDSRTNADTVSYPIVNPNYDFELHLDDIM